MFEKKDKEKHETIREIAIKLAKEQLELKKSEAGPKERTILFFGSRRAGKTTAINKFFDREDNNTRPTLALEYSFARRTSPSYSSGQKQILNLWELGGGLESCEKSLIEIPAKLHGIDSFSALLFLDLSKPEYLWSTFKYAHESLENICNLIENSGNTVERVKKEHKDFATLKLLPIPIVIIGGNYDLFVEFAPELKKSVCVHLRAMAHFIGASLFFFSIKIPKLSKTMRDIISNLDFGSPSQPMRTTIFDSSQPLSIWFGCDCWEKLGVSQPMTLERISFLFGQEVNQLDSKTDKDTVANDPAKDSGFQESVIDDLRAQKDAELASIIKENQLRGKFEKVVM